MRTASQIVDAGQVRRRIAVVFRRPDLIEVYIPPGDLGLAYVDTFSTYTEAMAAAAAAQGKNEPAEILQTGDNFGEWWLSGLRAVYQAD